MQASTRREALRRSHSVQKWHRSERRQYLDQHGRRPARGIRNPRKENLDG